MNLPSDTARLEVLAAELRRRIGEDHAITIDQIGQLLGLGRRQTEAFMELYIGSFPFCVIATSRGYCRPATAEDINHYRNANRSRIRCLAIRNRAITQAAIREGFAREGKVFVDRPVQPDLIAYIERKEATAKLDRVG